MVVNEIEENRSHPLADEVANVYRVFSRHEAPRGFGVCTWCCMDAQMELQMRKLPLKQLTQAHLYAYNGAVMVSKDDTSDVVYLLPRVLELLAEGAELHLSAEIQLALLGKERMALLTAAEQAAVNRFALAYMKAYLSGDLSAGAKLELFDGAYSVLLMFDIGGVDISPLLDAWLRCDGPWSTVHYVQDSYWEFWEQRDVCDPFSDDRPEFRQKLRSWMLSPENMSHFAAKLLDDRFQQFVPGLGKSNGIDFSIMVDAVFDQLMEV